MIHSAFKIRREELEQLRQGLEYMSLITFLKLSKACMKFVFPVQSEVEVTREDFLSLIDKHWLDSLSGNQKMTVDWFLQNVNEVNQGDAGTVQLMVHILWAILFDFCWVRDWPTATNHWCWLSKIPLLMPILVISLLQRIWCYFLIFSF